MKTITNQDRSTPITELEAAHGHDLASHTDAGTRGVLLLGGDFQSLGVARELSAEGIPVFLLETERGIARHSRSVSRRESNFNLLDAPDGAEFLIKLARRESLDGWAIFCVDDETVEFLAKNHAALSEHFLVPVPPWEITQHFYNKDLAYELAEREGIPIPKYYRFESLDDLLDQQIRYPIVLKPTFKKNYYDKTKDKAVRVSDRDELEREFRAMNRLIPTTQIVVQEFLPGGPQNLYSFAALFDGDRVVSGMSAHRLRQHPMDFGHATTYAESREIPLLEAQATRFMKALKYRGVAEVEFMFDEVTGEYKFMEMNGRFWGWHTLTYAAGLNFPSQLFQMLQGIEIPRKRAKVGVRWTRLITDAVTVAGEAFRFRMSLLVFLRLLWQRKTCAVWSWRDPLPFIAEAIIAPYLWWKKGF